MRRLGVARVSSRITRFEKRELTDGRVWIFAPDPGRSYRFQYSPAPAGSAWIDITNFTGHADPLTLIDPTTPADSRFYRVISP